MNLFEKLLEVKKKVPYLKKGTKAYQFNYASPETVLGHINPLLNDQGILLKVEVLSVNSGRVVTKTKTGEKDETLYQLSMKYTWVNCDDPTDTDENFWFGSGVNGDEQGFGSALTYAERYFMLKYFNIPTGKDDPDSFIDRQKAKSNNLEKSIKKELKGKELKAGETLNNMLRDYKLELKGLKTRKELGEYYEELTTKEREEALPYLAERKAELK